MKLVHNSEDWLINKPTPFQTYKQHRIFVRNQVISLQEKKTHHIHVQLHWNIYMLHVTYTCYTEMFFIEGTLGRTYWIITNIFNLNCVNGTIAYRFKIKTQTKRALKLKLKVSCHILEQQAYATTYRLQLPNAIRSIQLSQQTICWQLNWCPNWNFVI